MRQFTLALLAILIVFGCAKETLNDQQTVVPEIPKQELKQYKTPYEINQVHGRSSCNWTEIAAGSSNALASAIDNACEGGIIYLKAGTHTQSEVLTITKEVKIIGEAGAILKIKSNLTPYTEDFLQPIHPGIHIKGAPGTLIQDLEIQAIDGEGGTGILVENSPYTGIMRNKIPNFQFAILIVKSDFSTAMFNKIASSTAWQTGEVQEVNSIINVSGKSAYIADNEVSNSFFGIWACDSYGTYERNYTHDNYIGLILCNVPPYLIMPDGTIESSPTPGNEWKVRNNKSTNNAHVGYLVIDGANNNLLENNEAANNGDYDMELTTETLRFGVPVPEAYENTVNVGSFSNIRIKNCGSNNTINGGRLVDNSLEPCN